MKLFTKLATSLVFLILFSCTVKVSSPLDSDVNDGLNGWPKYSTEPLSGRVFESPWSYQMAVAKEITTNPDALMVYFYSEVVPNACDMTSVSQRPTASLIIPKNYTAKEYYFDAEQTVQNAHPVIFGAQSGLIQKSVFSERTKFKINQIGEWEFSALLYAKATESDQKISEVNGTMNVTDCTRQSTFSEWDELFGNYILTSFDGTPQNKLVDIQFDLTQSFVHPNTSVPLKTLILPLFYESNSFYDFGPMEGLGTNRVSMSGGVKNYIYSYAGPLIYKGRPITISLDLSVSRSGARLDVSYSLTMSGFRRPSSHNLVFIKR